MGRERAVSPGLRPHTMGRGQGPLVPSHSRTGQTSPQGLRRRIPWTVSPPPHTKRLSPPGPFAVSPSPHGGHEGPAWNSAAGREGRASLLEGTEGPCSTRI